MGGEYAVELRNVTKTFGTLKANDQINLKVRTGTIHGLIGETGAGKSTARKCVLFRCLRSNRAGIVSLLCH